MKREKYSFIIALMVSALFLMFFSVDIYAGDEFLITSFNPISSEYAMQSLTAYSEETPELPTHLEANVATEEMVMVPVEWTCNKTFDNKVAGTYTYTAAIDLAYKLQEGATLPKIIVMVEKCDTKITAIAKAPTWTYGKSAYDTVNIYNGYGRTLKLQMYSDGKWVTKKTYALKDAKQETLKVYYSNDWWKKTTSSWRMTIASNSGINGYTSSTIKMTKKKCNTKITGILHEPSWTARKSAYDTITVSNGYGRTLKLQMYSNGKWVTKKSVALKNTASQKMKLYYPNNWWKVTSSKWRIYIPSSGAANSYKSNTIKFTTKRYYQNPSNYIQIQNKITIDNSGSYTLKYGYMGLKVRKVNQYFGIGDWHWPRYTATTQSYVRNFQKRKGLAVTGNVDKKTWLAMGYSENYWNNAGAYVSPIKVNPSSTKKEHIEAMIDRAYDYLGDDYVVGASGKPGQGTDCSGIVMQALYAAGIEMPGINPVTHSWAGHEFESRNIWNQASFKKVSYSDKKRGDLIFYKGPSGYVNHIAIYLGDGKVIEAYPNAVRVASINHDPIAGVMRVFN